MNDKLQSAFDELALINDNEYDGISYKAPLKEFYIFHVNEMQLRFNDNATEEIKKLVSDIFKKHLGETSK